VTLPVGAVPADESANARQRAAAQRYGDAVRVETAPGKVELISEVAGGDAIVAPGVRSCSAGFTVTDGAFNYVLTAGHCTRGFPNWINWDGASLGPTVQSNFPGVDYGLILINGPVAPLGGVYVYNGFTIHGMHGWRTAVKGLSLCKSGKTTGLTCGVVRATGVTSTGSTGTLRNMIETNICAEPGDSGGSLFSDHIAYGLASRSRLDSNDRCLTGSSTRSWFQQVGPALTAYGVALIWGP
jgi:streptogrisin D